MRLRITLQTDEELPSPGTISTILKAFPQESPGNATGTPGSATGSPVGFVTPFVFR